MPPNIVLVFYPVYLQAKLATHTDFPVTPSCPPALLVSSEGGAGEWKGSFLGVYDLQGGTHDSWPWYKQRHTVDTTWEHFLYRCWIE